MTTVRELHQRAMETAQQASLSRDAGDQRRADELALVAVDLEERAADLVPLTPDAEPTRSILYRSAASLAMQANQFSRARELIAAAFRGNPSSRLENELLDVLSEVRYREHLSFRQRALLVDNLDLRLVGPGVGYGAIAYKLIQKRITALISLIDRAHRRGQHQAFQTHGPTKHKQAQIVPMISGMSAGSFILTMEFLIEQQNLFSDQRSAIDSVLTGLSLVNAGESVRLREEIPEESYFDHFVSNARELAPDGDDVTEVVLTTRTRSVAVTTTRAQIATSSILPVEEVIATVETIDGIISRADADTSTIWVNTETGGRQTIQVREGMRDLVRGYWEDPVRLQVAATGKKSFNLLTIDPLPE